MSVLEPDAPVPPPELHRDSPKRVRAPVVLDLLREELPDARIALNFSNDWELLVATILSAQCTDKKVNEVTATFFPDYPGPRAVAEATRDELEDRLRPTGFFRQKTKAVQGCARMLLEEFDGAVPSTMEELLRLPGVARKTANVVLSNAFGTNAGVVVDTHVFRISHRLGFTRRDDPVGVERDLMKLYPRERWLEVADLFIHHGRSTCVAQRPRCGDCVVEQLCPSSQVAGRRDRWRSTRRKAVVETIPDV